MNIRRAVAVELSTIISDCWMSSVFVFVDSERIRSDMVMDSSHRELHLGRSRSHTTFFLRERKCISVAELSTIISILFDHQLKVVAIHIALGLRYAMVI